MQYILMIFAALLIAAMMTALCRASGRQLNQFNEIISDNTEEVNQDGYKERP